MNSRSTWFWFVVAAILFAFIFVSQHYFHPAAAGVGKIFPGLQPQAVTSVQVIPSGASEIRADRTNNEWLLTEPVLYPAQPAAIEALLTALQALAPDLRINAAELRQNPNSDAEFGFENPQTTLVIESGGGHWQLKVGNKTAPGNQVYLRVVGVDGAFVVDAGWLKFIPQSANDWRNTALVDAGQNDFDSIVLTNGAKVIELHRDATNRLWRMTRPLQARANNDLITAALQQLQAARVTQFVTDDSNADLTAFGLQPADLDLWLARGTNFAAAVHIGKSPTNDAAQVYARREGWNAIVTTAKEPLSPWYDPFNGFRDPYLLELTAPVAEIEVRGTNNFDYILRRQGTNNWQVAGEKFPVDADSVQSFLKVLAGLRIADFVQDVAPDWPAYGLATPQRQIILRSTAGDTNSAIVQLSFGSAQTNEVFVRRADEDFVYAITPEDFNVLSLLSKESWNFRERQIWNFTENDVAQITVHQDGKTRQIIHNGPNKWSLAPGSQGIIDSREMEQTAHWLGQLAAVYWIGRNVTDPSQFGRKSGDISFTVELKDGEKFSVDMGAQISDQSALAATTLDGERWAFVFPPGPYMFVLSYLTIPANVPQASGG
ncbi:MAG TPA: DUF4340 domain-containing protein [Verrucomicrobiae bacterium]|jgi:hypothetical protein